MDATICLGLCLAWTRTRGSMKSLQLIFGLTSSVLSSWMRFGQRILIKALKNDPHARVEMPTDAELASFVTSVATKYPPCVLRRRWEIQTTVNGSTNQDVLLLQPNSVARFDC